MYIVYGLKCVCHPERGIRYVGRTVNLSARIYKHLSMAKKPSRLPVYKWWQSHGLGNVEAVTLSRHSTFMEMLEEEARQIAASPNLMNVLPGDPALNGGPTASEETLREAGRKGSLASAKVRRARTAALIQEILAYDDTPEIH